MIGADKGGFQKMMETDQASYKYTRQICEVLPIEPAMINNPAIEPVGADEWALTVAAVKALPDAEQHRLLRMLKAAVEK
jgi:hypothetical protein